MKSVIKTVFFLILFLACVLVAAQLVIDNKAASLIRSNALPPIQKRLGVPVGLQNASVNLFTGAGRVGGVKVSNPRGFGDAPLFSVDGVSVVVRPDRILLHGVWDVSRAEVRNVVLTVVKKSDKTMNVAVVADSARAQEQKQAPVAGEKAPARPEGQVKATGSAEPTSTLPPVVVRALETVTLVRYVDHTTSEKYPVDIALKHRFVLRGVSTSRAATEQYGTIEVTGGLADDPNMWVTNLKGEIAPIRDPLKLNFDLSGEIASIDTKQLEPYLQQAGVAACESLTLKVNLECRDGVFNEDRSVIACHMKNITFTGKALKNLPPGVTTLGSLTIPVPIGGTLAEPRTGSAAEILSAAIMGGLKDNVIGTIQNVLKDNAVGTVENLTDKALGVMGNLLGESGRGRDKGGSPQPAKDPARSK